jgi:hypothetical protein
VTEAQDGTSNAERPVSGISRWVRRIHFYSSMALAGLILFYASTGFMASRSNLFDTNERSIQKAEGALPEGIALEAKALSAWLSRSFPGRLQEKTVVTDDSQIRFEMESVWSWHEVTVDCKARTYVVNTTPSSKASSLMGLHRGKWAGPIQRLLMDATALALIVATCTGIFIGVTHPVRSRRWAAIALVAASVALVFLLCLGR